MKKLQKNSLFTFLIKKYNLETLELEARLSGHSESMLAIRGLNVNEQ